MATRKAKTAASKSSALKDIVKNSSSPIKPQLETLCDAIEALDAKLQNNMSDYLAAPLSVEMTRGEDISIYRTNPFVEEYRATLKDYTTALLKLQELLKGNIQKTEISSLDSLRNKFKIAK